MQDQEGGGEGREIIKVEFPSESEEVDNVVQETGGSTIQATRQVRADIVSWISIPFHPEEVRETII